MKTQWFLISGNYTLIKNNIYGYSAPKSYTLDLINNLYWHTKYVVENSTLFTPVCLTTVMSWTNGLKRLRETIEMNIELLWFWSFHGISRQYKNIYVSSLLCTLSSHTSTIAAESLGKSLLCLFLPRPPAGANLSVRCGSVVVAKASPASWECTQPQIVQRGAAHYRATHNTQQIYNTSLWQFIVFIMEMLVCIYNDILNGNTNGFVFLNRQKSE